MPRRLRFSLLAALLLHVAAPVANAASVESLGSVDCTGSLSSSFMEVALMQCSGDFSLDGGSIVSDTRITITSGGALALDNLTISAPLIEFISQGTLTLGNGARINGHDLFITAGTGGSGSMLPIPQPVVIASGSAILLGNGSPGIPPLPLNPGTLQVINWQSFSVTSGGSLTITTAIPEPGTWLLMLAGLLAVLVLGGRDRQRQASAF